MSGSIRVLFIIVNTVANSKDKTFPSPVNVISRFESGVRVCLDSFKMGKESIVISK